MKTPRHNAGCIVPTFLPIMIMKEISIERRQNMVRSLREAGVSFDEIVTILRVGSQCAEQAGFRRELPASMPDGDTAREMQAL